MICIVSIPMRTRGPEPRLVILFRVTKDSCFRTDGAMHTRFSDKCHYRLVLYHFDNSSCRRSKHILIHLRAPPSTARTFANTHIQRVCAAQQTSKRHNSARSSMTSLLPIFILEVTGKCSALRCIMRAEKRETSC